MIFGSYIAGACRDDTLLKREIVIGTIFFGFYFFNYSGKRLCQLIMGQSIGNDYLQCYCKFTVMKRVHATGQPLLDVHLTCVYCVIFARELRYPMNLILY